MRRCRFCRSNFMMQREDISIVLQKKRTTCYCRPCLLLTLNLLCATNAMFYPFFKGTKYFIYFFVTQHRHCLIFGRVIKYLVIIFRCDNSTFYCLGFSQPFLRLFYVFLFPDWKLNYKKPLLWLKARQFYIYIYVYILVFVRSQVVYQRKPSFIIFSYIKNIHKRKIDLYFLHVRLSSECFT